MNSKELKHFGMGGLSLVPMDTPASSLFHYGVKGQRWGVRRYQNEDGSLTKAGQKRLSRQIRREIKNSYPGPNDGFKNISKIEAVRNIDRSKIRSLQQDLSRAMDKVNSDNDAFVSNKNVNRKYLEAVRKESLSVGEHLDDDEAMNEAWRRYSREKESIASNITRLSKAYKEVEKESERIARDVLGIFGDKKVNVSLNPSSTVKKVLADVIEMYDESSNLRVIGG